MDIPPNLFPVHHAAAHARRGFDRRAGALLAAVVCMAALPLHAAQSELLLNPSAAIGDELGFALEQDGNFVASGSPGEDGATGAVHLFDCTMAPCAAPVRIEATDGAPGDRFGASLALDGDTLVIGAPGRIPAAVYVLVRSGGAWSQQARVESPGGASAAGFAGAVALSGDRLAVGAERADDDAGAAYLFHRDGSAWSAEARLVAAAAAPGHRFGRAVALRGGTLVAGAPFEAGTVAGGFARGALHVFQHSGTAWSQAQVLVAADASDGDLLGLSVALAEGRILAGAPMANARAGAAVLFEVAGGAWTQRARLSAPAGLPGDRFGWSVAFAADGAPLVGAPCALDGCGAATLFHQAGALWQPTSQAVLDAPLPASMAGWAVSAAGNRFVVASPGHAGALEHRGGIHLFGGGDALFGDGFELPVAEFACERK